MKRIVIFGNSGSGKSTLAKHLCDKHQLTHLDLDTLAWEATQPPTRTPLTKSQGAIDAFIAEHSGWLIEGCYSDLIQFALDACNELYFMDLPVDSCIENAKNRPWEPHKYESKEAQDKNLSMLIDWIGQYEQRQDTFSRQAHHAMFEQYRGTKHRFTSNPELQDTLETRL